VVEPAVVTDLVLQRGIGVQRQQVAAVRHAHEDHVVARPEVDAHAEGLLVEPQRSVHVGDEQVQVVEPLGPDHERTAWSEREAGVMSASITVTPIDGCTLGAVVTDVRLADLDDATWQQVEAAFHEHAVLVFPAQHLSPDEQRSFALRFGDLEVIVGKDGLTPITTQKRDGTLLAPDDPVMGIIRGNEGWHTDSSYMPVSAKASMLSAHVVPSSGGGTEWADMRDAYDALPADLREKVDTLEAFHSIVYSQQRAGYATSKAFGYGYDVADTPLRPLTKVHPVTGRTALSIGRHAHAIPGLPEDESEQLLDELLELATQPPRTYEHRWSPGDLVVWDNRCVLHRARPWPLEEPRTMLHTRIQGDPRTESVEGHRAHARV
jgi:alpha-ketoglutarate-dependent taurine dioxygenase